MQNFINSSSIVLFIVLLIIFFQNFHCSTIAPTIFSSSTSSANCYDQGTNCPFREQLCNNALYFNLMSWQCPWTCNRCPPDGSNPTRPPNIMNPPLPNRNCKDFLE
ncbi:hypothetical protein GPALN_004209 [Globodera pallida]|nr:hypothetical protein GPALN_004209 [Globodera pallida]